MVTAEDVERSKPAPDGYLLAAKLLQVNIGDCLVFEDAPAGIEAGVTAGASVIVVAALQSEPPKTRHTTIDSYQALRVAPGNGGVTVQLVGAD